MIEHGNINNQLQGFRRQIKQLASETLTLSGDNSNTVYVNDGGANAIVNLPRVDDENAWGTEIVFVNTVGTLKIQAQGASVITFLDESTTNGGYIYMNAGAVVKLLLCSTSGWVITDLYGTVFYDETP